MYLLLLEVENLDNEINDKSVSADKLHMVTVISPVIYIGFCK